MRFKLLFQRVSFSLDINQLSWLIKKMYSFNLHFIIHLIFLNLCHTTLDSRCCVVSTQALYSGTLHLMELSALSRSCQSRILTGNMDLKEQHLHKTDKMSTDHPKLIRQEQKLALILSSKNNRVNIASSSVSETVFENQEFQDICITPLLFSLQPSKTSLFFFAG